MGAYGLIVPPEAFYHEIGTICRDYGILLIVDEVTTGFGKSGKLFMSEDWKIQPDIMCLAKTISNGYLPLSATLATEEIYERFLGPGNELAHGSTASGHPVCAAVGMANIDIIINEKIPDNAAQIGRYLMDKLQALAQKNKHIGEVRGKGLIIGIELVKDKNTKEPLSNEVMLELMLDSALRGMVIYTTRNIIGLFPPLIINEGIADEICAILEKVINLGTSANLGRKARLAKELASTKLKA
jgi:adenosylmethionine-8-amino-7-oxononanoate aminotransferase